jgi:hypothetical protein
MARPPCPACGDNFSVAKVTSVYRSLSTMRSQSGDSGLVSANSLVPPPLNRAGGRLICVAAGVGGLLAGSSGWRRALLSSGCVSHSVRVSHLRFSCPGSVHNAKTRIDTR